MGSSIAEEYIKASRFARRQRLRVDLHGVSLFGPGDHHTAIRWEWIEELSIGSGVMVRSAKGTITIPSGTFGLTPAALADKLERAKSITARPDILTELATGGTRRR